jgi:MFS family permease
VFVSESVGRVNSKTSTWKLVLLGLFGATAGQGVLWYTSQFQTQFFLQEVLRVQSHPATTILVAALILSLPMFVLFGWLSDKIGAKKTVTIGCLCAALLLYPIYRGIAAATRSEAISIRMLKSPSSGGMKLTPVANQSDGSFKVLNVAAKPMIVALVVLVFVQAALVAMVSGPIAAYLVKLFPANRRCTCVSLSYQLGNSVFGGSLPFITLAVISSTSGIYSWLLYPVAILLLTFLIGFFIVRADAKSQYHLR